MAGDQLQGRSAEAALRAMVERAVVGVSGCCGATSSTWVGLDRVLDISSHPDLSVLVQQPAGHAESPTSTAARTGAPTAIRDTLTDRRWSRFARAALAVGVRSLTCGAVRTRGSVVTCTLYSLRPDGLAVGSTALATALIRESVYATAQHSDYERARREVHHLTQAIAAREVVEQAKGMIMQALGCDPATAFAHLAQVSRQDGIRIAAAARRLVDSHPAPPAPLSDEQPHPGSRRA